LPQESRLGKKLWELSGKICGAALAAKKRTGLFAL